MTSYYIEALGLNIEVSTEVGPGTTSYVLTGLLPATTYELVKINLPGSD